MKDLLLSIKKELLKKGADDVVIDEEHVQENRIKFVNNQVVHTQQENSREISVLMAIKKKVVMTTIKEPTQEVIDKTIKQLFSFSHWVEPNEDYLAIAKGPFRTQKIKGLYDQKVSDLCEKGMDMVGEAIDLASVRGAKRSSGILEWEHASNRTVTSGDVDNSCKGTSIYFSIRSFTDKDASGAQTSCSNTLKKLDYKGASKKAAEIAVLAKHPQKGKEGVYDILFDCLPAANLLNPFMQAASAFEVKNGNSFFQKMLGKKVASEKLTLLDQGNLPHGFNSLPFDEEGRPTQKNTIIQKGILKTYLHNTSTAHLFKTKSTSNAGIIAPHPFNIVVERGNMNNPLKEIDQGLYITNVWYTRFHNYITGDFSTVPRDGIFLVKNGQIVQSLKDIRISDNLPAMMKRIAALGKEQKQIYGWEVETPVVTPQFIIEKVNVTKSSE